MSRPLDGSGAPGEPGTEPHHRDRVSRMQTPLLMCLAHCNWDRCAGCITVAIDIDEDTVSWNAKTPYRRVDDTSVRLMGDEQVDVGNAQVRLCQHLVAGIGNHAGGKAKDLRAGHLEEVHALPHGLLTGRHATPAGR